MDGVQIPLDGAEGQPAVFPQGRHQAEQVDPQPLLPQRHTRQVRWRRPALLTYRADPGDIDVLGNFCRNRRQIDDFPGTLGPAPGQLGSAARTIIHHVLHPAGWRHALAGEAVGPWIPVLFLPGGPLARLRLDPRHSPGAARLGLSFQSLNPPLQLDDDRLLCRNCSLQLQNSSLLLGDGRQQDFTGSGRKIKARVHAAGLT